MKWRHYWTGSREFNFGLGWVWHDDLRVVHVGYGPGTVALTLRETEIDPW